MKIPREKPPQPITLIIIIKPALRAPLRRIEIVVRRRYRQRVAPLIHQRKLDDVVAPFVVPVAAALEGGALEDGGGVRRVEGFEVGADGGDGGVGGDGGCEEGEEGEEEEGG